MDFLKIETFDFRPEIFRDDFFFYLWNHEVHILNKEKIRMGSFLDEREILNERGLHWPPTVFT